MYQWSLQSTNDSQNMWKILPAHEVILGISISCHYQCGLGHQLHLSISILNLSFHHFSSLVDSFFLSHGVTKLMLNTFSPNVFRIYLLQLLFLGYRCLFSYFLCHFHSSPFTLTDLTGTVHKHFATLSDETERWEGLPYSRAIIPPIYSRI